MLDSWTFYHQLLSTFCPLHLCKQVQDVLGKHTFMDLGQPFLYPSNLTISSNLEAHSYAEIVQMTTEGQLFKLPVHGWNPGMTWPTEKLGIE
jgi:hypothetical protein